MIINDNEGYSVNIQINTEANERNQAYLGVLIDECPRVTDVIVSYTVSESSDGVYNLEEDGVRIGIISLTKIGIDITLYEPEHSKMEIYNDTIDTLTDEILGNESYMYTCFQDCREILHVNEVFGYERAVKDIIRLIPSMSEVMW